jgi:Putative beta-barrel porin-2, OmpL-like. bbp2
MGGDKHPLNLGRNSRLTNMKNRFERTLIRRAAAMSVMALAAYALSSGSGYAQLTMPSVAAGEDGKETKEVEQLVEPPKPAKPLFDLYGWIEAGITGNPNAPADNHNFGHVFTDRANEPLLNQMSIVAERVLDPNTTGFDWGFKFWFMYGSDSRYSKSLGLLDLATNARVQPDFWEISASVRLPIPSTDGLDLKIGKYQDPMTAEGGDPRGNIFYSHSYIFNFGHPGNETGILATLHVNKYLDLYAGINRGANASIQDNNHSAAFEGGFGLHLLDGNLTVLGLTLDGPEDPHNNHDWRYLNDITTIWKVTKSFTSITDLNLVYDTLANGKWGGGVAQYFSYAINDWLQIGMRGEIWRDSAGFFVSQFRANNDVIHFARGDNLSRSFPFDPSNLGGGKTTYLELTWGLTIKPPMPKPFTGLLIRPEVRYDRALTDQFEPFSQNTSDDQVTLGLDVVMEF